jgi:hypothetical protein
MGTDNVSKVGITVGGAREAVGAEEISAARSAVGNLKAGELFAAQKAFEPVLNTLKPAQYEYQPVPYPYTPAAVTQYAIDPSRLTADLSSAAVKLQPFAA